MTTNTVLLQSKFFGPEATKFFAVEEETAQYVYDDLFTHKPTGFEVYREDDEDVHIVVELPVAVDIKQIQFHLLDVHREKDGRLMARMFIDEPKELAMHLQASGVSPIGICELGRYSKNGIGEIFHLKYQKEKQPDYLLIAHPTTDPALDDWI